MIAAHFKNGKTKHFLSEIPQEYKSGKTLRLKKCQWSYGAPGHGKGSGTASGEWCAQISDGVRTMTGPHI